jgi:TPR repeat protein
MRTRLATFALAGALGLLPACGPGAVGSAVRPEAPTAASALGDDAATCHDVAAGGEPLVVDWKPEQRGDLEEAMHDGVAVVEYSCKGIKLLKGCRIEGKYGFLGMTKREQVVRLSNSDELQANLPSFGGPAAAKLSAEMQRGATLDIAMITVGKQRTTWEEPTTEDLKGKCDGATHYIRGALVGAFVLKTGTKGEVKAAAEMFGVSASGSSSSEKDVRNQDGDPDDCKTSAPDAAKAPPQCGAPVRLSLSPIVKPDPAKAEAEPKAEKAPPGADEESCPAGLVLSEGKCTDAKSASTYQCEPGDEASCKEQCDKGHPGSCGALGRMLANGYKVSRDEARAATVLQKGCDGGDAPSCTALGRLSADGRGTKEDPAGAAKLWEKACAQGDAPACGLLGAAFEAGRGVTADPARSAALYGQACSGGDDRGCAAAAALYAAGRGVARDVAKAAELYERACQGSEAAACEQLGGLFEVGDGVRKDAIYASMLYRRGCYRGAADACVGLGRLLHAGAIGGAPDEAKRMFEMGCMRRATLGCAALKVAFGDTRPVFPDIARQQALSRSCMSGNARDCAIAGVLDVAAGNPQGKFNLDMACTRGDAWGCVMSKAAKK